MGGQGGEGREGRRKRRERREASLQCTRSSVCFCYLALRLLIPPVTYQVSFPSKITAENAGVIMPPPSCCLVSEVLCLSLLLMAVALTELLALLPSQVALHADLMKKNFDRALLQIWLVTISELKSQADSISDVSENGLLGALSWAYCGVLDTCGIV